MAKLGPRDWTPGPLVYPYSAFDGPIPGVVQDRIAFAAFKARSENVALSSFIVQSWEDFRFPHLKMLHLLQEQGYLRREVDSCFGDSWGWVPADATRRSEASSDDAKRRAGFSAVDAGQEFFSSVVVAPKISPMGWTHP